MQRISINGVSAEHVSVMDRGLHYGDGLFETIACVDGKLQFWDDHISRMEKGAHTLDIHFPTGALYLSDIKNLVGDDQGSYIIKLLLTRGQGERGYSYPDSQRPTRIVMVNDWPDYPGYPGKANNGGAHLCFCKHAISVNKDLSGIKHLNRLDNILARNEWKNEFHEGLMLDINGNIIEGTMSNVFGIKDAALYTPVLDNCGVEGVIRKHIIEISKDIEMPLHISNLSKDDMCSMDEVFITNSLIGIWPVSYIDDKSIKTGEKTKVFSKELKERIISNEKHITS